MVWEGIHTNRLWPLKPLVDDLRVNAAELDIAVIIRTDNRGKDDGRS